MNRRGFLTITGLASLASAVRLCAGRTSKAAVSLNVRLQRRTARGEIFGPAGSGLTGQRGASFGAGHPMSGLNVRRDRAQAQIGVALPSTGGRLCRTPGARSAWLSAP